MVKCLRNRNYLYTQLSPHLLLWSISARHTYTYGNALVCILINLTVNDAHQSRFLAEGYAFAGNIQISILSQVTHVFSNRIELLPLCCLHIQKGTSVDCVGLLHCAASHLRLQIELFLPSLHGFEGLFQFGDLRTLSALSISQLEVTEFLARLDDSNRWHASPLRWAPTKSDSGSPHLALAFTAIQRLSRLCHGLPQTFHLCWSKTKNISDNNQTIQVQESDFSDTNCQTPSNTQRHWSSNMFLTIFPACCFKSAISASAELAFSTCAQDSKVHVTTRSKLGGVGCLWLEKIAVQVAAFFFKSSWMSCSSLTVVSKCSTCRYNVHFQIFSSRPNLLWSLNKAFQWHQYVSDAKLCRIKSHPSHQLTFCAGSPSVTWRRRASTSSARVVTCKCKTFNIYKF